MLGVTNLEKDFNGAERLELFGQEIISQISLGRTEPVEKILDEMGKKNVVRYLYNKYKDDWFLSLDDNCPYNVDDWEEIFNKYSNRKQLLWVQEEPENMGAWSYILRNFRKAGIDVIAPVASGSPAPGSHKMFEKNQNNVINRVFDREDAPAKRPVTA